MLKFQKEKEKNISLGYRAAAEKKIRNTKKRNEEVYSRKLPRVYVFVQKSTERNKNKFIQIGYQQID